MEEKHPFDYSKLQKLKPINPPEEETVKLTFKNGVQIDLPILKPTIGPPMIDIKYPMSDIDTYTIRQATSHSTPDTLAQVHAAHN